MVESTLNYLAAMTEKPYYYLCDPPAGTRWRNTVGDPRAVEIHDARSLSPEPSLDREGFTLVRQTSAIDDFYDPQRLKEHYYPEVEALMLQATGAARVLVFDHNVRNAERAKETDSLSQNPVRFVHCDYTEASGPRLVVDLALPDELERLRKMRFAAINAWRPIRGPLVDTPLAICDARTVGSKDLFPTELRYSDRNGEIYSFTFNADHRWYYYPRMETDEVLLLKCFDSDPERARFTAHTAFDDPTTPEDGPSRESIEARTLVFWDD